MTPLLTGLLAVLSASPDAQAADFSGRVRRIRIRENNNDSNFRAVVQTESGDPADPGSLAVAVEGLESGKTWTLSAKAKKTRVLATATASFARPRPIETVYTMTATMRGLADPTTTSSWSLSLPRCEADCAWTEEVLADGTVARARLTVTEEADGSEALSAELRLLPQGELDLSLEGVLLESDDADGDGLADESADADLGEGPVYRTRWLSEAWSSTDDALQLEAVLTNPDGSTDSLADFAVLDLGGETGLAEAAVKPRRKGGYKVSLWTQATGDAPVGSVFAELSDADTDEHLGELDLDAPVETTAVLTAALDPSLSQGEKVGLTVHLYAGEELLLSEPLTAVLAEGLVDATFSEGGAVALSKVGLYPTDDGGLALSFSVTGADADLVDLSVVDLTSRTAEGSYEATVELLWQRWAGVLDTDASPEALGFEAEVRDPDGVSIDGWVFEVQARYGTGTRSTAGTAKQKAELL